MEEQKLLATMLKQPMGKGLLFIPLTIGQSEKHAMWESTQFLFGELTVTGGMECSSVVEQRPCKLCATGSIPVFPIPMNCNHWNFSLTSFGSSVSRWEIYAVQVGTLDFFKLRRRLWILKYANIVVRVNGMLYMRVSDVMVTVNIVQIIDF